MLSSSLLSIAHLIGLALAVGSGTVKLVLLLRCRADPSFVAAYLQAARLITRLILVGMALLILSGIGWLLLGYPFTSLLMAKLVLVAAVLVLGPVIDKVFEPRFRSLAPQPGQAPSPAFIGAQRQYLTVEIVANLLFYVTIVMWVLR